MTLKKPLAVIFSDSHLAPGAWSRRPIVGDAYHSLSQVFDYAVATRAPAVLGLGDLFDVKRPEPEPLGVFFEQLEKLKTANILFGYLQGQHEYWQKPWLSLHSWPVYLHEHLLDLEGIKLYGLDYLPPDKIEAGLANIPKATDVLLTHQVWGDVMGHGGEVDLASVPVVNLIISGDLHKHEQHKGQGADGQPLEIIFPGSMCQQAIDEPPNKAFYVLYEDLSWKSIPLVTRPYIYSPHIQSVEALVDYLSKVPELIEEARGSVPTLPEELKKPVIRITYSADIAGAHNSVVNTVKDKAHLFVKELRPVSEHTKIGKMDKAQIEAGLIGCLSLVVPNKESAVYKTCQRLLSAPDPAIEYDNIRSECLNQKTPDKDFQIDCKREAQEGRFEG